MLTRFAPAPTGALHIGHVVHAIYVWETANTAKGRVLLRIEDHDRQRCRPEFEQALLEDLASLGFVADLIAPRQSGRDAAYRKALAPLINDGLVYGCDCTRKDVSGTRYPGTCRKRGLPLTDDIGWRMRIPPGPENPPRFMHHPLVMKTPTQKVGKSDRDTSVRDLRAAGWSPQRVIAEAYARIPKTMAR